MKVILCSFNICITDNVHSKKFILYNHSNICDDLGYSRNVKDQFHQPDATPEEIRLVNERLKLRKALRAEYLRKATDPHSTEPILVSCTISIPL